MTARDQVLRDYNVDANGVIRSPGKFEGEPAFVPYFWGLALEGFADNDDGRVYTFRFNPSDRDTLLREWPMLVKWLGRKRKLHLIENDQGFVHAF